MNRTSRSSLYLASILFWEAIFLPALMAQDFRSQRVSLNWPDGPWKNVSELKIAAVEGNPAACAQLGEQLLFGHGLPKDGPQSLALLEKAARGGIGSAAFRLGLLLEEGREVAQDRPRALAYFRAAAAAGNAEAYHNMGAAYAGAHGVKRNYTEALAWLILAKKHHVGTDPEKDVRDRILKLNHPDWVAAGEKRAPEIERELAAGSPESFLPPPAPLIFIGSSWGNSHYTAIDLEKNSAAPNAGAVSNFPSKPAAETTPAPR